MIIRECADAKDLYVNRRNYLLLFLVGVCLSVSQFVMIRDFVAILYGEEVVIILVTMAFFAALSAGYRLSLLISRKTFETLSLITAFLHLTFPFSYRYLAVEIDALPYKGYFYLGFLFLYALIFSAIFAAFLPRLVSSDQSGEPERNLKIFYSIELAGFGVGLLLVGWSWNRPLAQLLAVYWALLGVVLHLAIGKKSATAGFLLVAIVAAWNADEIDKRSAALLYEHKHHRQGAKVLLTMNSPYQKVEVVENFRGERYLYLDGLMHLNSSDLETLNYYIAEVPAKLTRPEKALIVGNGTLSSISKVYPYAQWVDLVEIDSGVLLAGERFFSSREKLASLDRWRLTVDDGKHFLMQSIDRFDLIVMDVPSPLGIQPACLHTVEFFQLAHDRMTKRGVMAVQLSGRLQRNNRSPARIVAALSKAFKNVMVVDSEKGDRSFAYASDEFPFTVDDVRRETEFYEKTLKIITPDRVPSYLAKAVPLAVDNLDLALRRGWERFADRYFND